MEKLLLIKAKILLIILAITVITLDSCKKEENTQSQTTNSTSTDPTLDTTVNVDLVLVAYNPGSVPPQTLTIRTQIVGVSQTTSSNQSMQTIQGYQNLTGVYWYTTSTPPIISAPCTTSCMPFTMKFSKTKKVNIDINLDNSIRNCEYHPITHVITNNAGTFQIDRTCKPGKWVILCSK